MNPTRLLLWSSVVLICAACGCAEQEVQSRLRISPPEVDLGEVRPHVPVEAKVNVENPTEKTITIKSVQATCGCAAPSLSATEIPAGKSVTLSIQYKGNFGKKNDKVQVVLTTAESGSPAIRIPVSAKIIQEFTAEPDTLRFGRLQKGESKTLESIIKSTDGKPFSIHQVETHSKEFVCRYEPVAGSNNAAFKLSVTGAGIQGGSLVRAAKVSTDRGEAGVVMIFLNADVANDAVCTPDTLAAVASTEDITATFETVVKRTTPGRLEIKRVTEMNHRSIEVSTKQIDDSSVKLTIQLKEPVSRCAAFSEFVIITNAEESPAHLSYSLRLPPPQLKK